MACPVRRAAGGVSIGDLIEATGKYRTWVYERLQEHAAAGRAVRTTRGRWRGITTGNQAGEPV